MRCIWPLVICSQLLNLSLQVDESGQEKQTTGNVRLDQRAHEPTDIYVIYPKDVTVKSQADAINEILDHVVVNKTTIYASEVNSHNMWTLFWNAALSESQANMIREDPNVSIASSIS